MGIEIFKEILNFPLRENPFFAKVISLGDAFSGDGIEDGESDSSGYICQTLGNLDCEEDHKPQCSGLGVIDCTSDCSGSEDEFKLFMKVMEDPDFAKKYPELYKAKMGGAKKEEKNMDESKEEDKVDLEEEVQEEEMAAGESKPDARAKFFSGIKKCTNFSDETLALVSMASGSGGSFGGDTSDPNSLTYVDPDAISDIANIEYDYSDYYDDDEEAAVDEDTKDIGKERRNAEKDDEIHHDHDKTINNKREEDKEEENTSRTSMEEQSFVEDVKKVEEFTKSQIKSKIEDKKMMDKVKHSSKSKAEYYNSLNNLDNVDGKDLTNEEKISLNMIRSVDEDLELKDTNLITQTDNKSIGNDGDNTTNTDKEEFKEKEIKDSVPMAQKEEGSGNQVESTTEEELFDEDIVTEQGNEYQDDDDELFKEETVAELSSTTESIIEKIVDIEIANDQAEENTEIGIDWEKLNSNDEVTDSAKEDDVNKSTSPPTTESAKNRVKRDVDDLQELFAKSLAIAKSDTENSIRVKRYTKSFNNDALAYKVAEKMRILLRKKRELETIETPKNTSMPDEMACSVKNMTCVKFPSKKHCKGIAVGRCGSRTDLLAKLFTPHVVMVTIVSVLVIVVVTVGLSYYCYKLKAENRVEPAEDEEEEPKNGEIKTVEPASPGDPPPA